jgi:hypothetical protein
MSSTLVKNRKGEHIDFYETPDYVTDGLLDSGFCHNAKTLLEPSAGKGAIIRRVLLRHPAINITAVEIQHKFSKDLNELIPDVIIADFFTTDLEPFDRIIANPPFSQAENFIKHAYNSLSINGRMAFLLRLSFLASVKRYKLFEKLRPSNVLILSQRPRFGGTNIDSCDYAWAIWDKCGTYVTTVDWIKPNER